MGCIWGKIEKSELSYKFIKNYCLKNSISIVSDYEDDKLITTSTIHNLIVISENQKEIKGVGSYIEGMDSEHFEVHVLGVSYPFYENEFPHHVKTYNDSFKEENET